ncbi:alpha,alpha-trehalase [bacterium]|nr:alpha,alpha-trehalase [bacterium]MCI0613235.1 alpha,alpha-trehalase [bacterium]
MNTLRLIFVLLICSLAFANSNVKTTLEQLLADEDTDNDKKITIDDPHITGTQRGDKRFWMELSNGQKYEISGTYYLSNLLQELSLASEAGKETTEIRAERIFEPPVDRITRSIGEFYWDGLTRRIDEKGLSKILGDEKTTTLDGLHHLYIPHSDQQAFKYYSAIATARPELKMKVDLLPEKISTTYVRGLDGYHGLLSLAMKSNEPVPFVVPGGRFNEMYGWDSYFITLGLLEDNRIELAKAMVDNFVYEITHYGAILNANRTYYLTRSQPPFLTSMALAVYEHLPKDAASKAWLKTKMQAAIQEYYQVWMNPNRLTKIGLSRYFDSGNGPPPEVEPGHFNVVFAEYAKKHGMDVQAFEEAYKSGKLKVPELDEYFVHDRCMRESGHDTSYRLEGRCADLTTVDLNSLLYKIETDIAATLDKEFAGTIDLTDSKRENSSDWVKKAEQRKALINRYLWNAKRGMYFDYDFVLGKQSEYVSATTLYPLWARLASKEQAEQIIKNALPLLEMPGGLVSSSEESRGVITPEHPLRQWDFPHGWSPHQVLAWIGFMNYQYEDIAQRLIYRWLFTITENAAFYNGTVPEKFDVVTRSHQVFAEYGNVGTKFSYITREGFGWTNGSYQLGLKILSKENRNKLNQLIAPEWIFQQSTDSRSN